MRCEANGVFLGIGIDSWVDVELPGLEGLQAAIDEKVTCNETCFDQVGLENVEHHSKVLNTFNLNNNRNQWGDAKHPDNYYENHVYYISKLLIF